MAKGEGANSRVVRLTPEQRESARRQKNNRLQAREERIRRQNREKVASMDQLQLTTEAVQYQARKDVEKKFGPISVLYERCKALKLRMKNAAWRFYMLRSGFAAALFLAGSFTAQCYDSAGALKWATGAEFNQVTTVGLNYLLNVAFHNDTVVATWYIGLVATGGTYSAADTMASNSWTEYTAYSETNRQTWTEDLAAGGSITNSTTVDFSMNATGTVAGMFLTSDSTKSGTAGTLWTTLNFSGGNQSVSNGDTLKVTYTLTASA